MSLNSEKLDDTSEGVYEPLGTPYYLYDVNIEYSPGGRRSHMPSERHSFKLKCLPYMIVSSREEYGDNSSNFQQVKQKVRRKNSIASSDSNTFDEDQSYSHSPRTPMEHPLPTIDVTKATCAFLGNSDYVPSTNFGPRRVVIEIISAKVSQAATLFPNVPQSPGYTSLVSTLAEQESPIRTPSGRLNSPNGLLLTPHQHNRHLGRLANNNNIKLITSSPSTPNRTPKHTTSSPIHTPPSASKRFVNYTLLIKTVPGLDKNPAVIERRFSDFLLLYQGLKSQESTAKLVDQHVTFPKKVYLGNFSLTNIAERSIEFSRLLNLCVTNDHLLRSIPFITFLMDKELKEAHRLSTCGDPDDVQALLETAHNIEQKLYLSGKAAQMSCDASISI